MCAESKPDEELFRLFLEGRDEHVFAELVRRHQALAYRIAFGYCGRTELAEEIVQEAFLKIAREPSPVSLKGYPSFTAWFSGVTSYVAKYVTRTERRTVNRSAKPAYLEIQTQLGRERQASSTQPCSDVDLQQALTQAMGQLSEELRLPLVLLYIQGLSQAEIGTLTGVSQPMVSKRIQKGINVLRTHLTQAGVLVSAVALPDLLIRAELPGAQHRLGESSIDALARRAAQQMPMRPVSVLPIHAFRIAGGIVSVLAAVTVAYFSFSVARAVPAPSHPVATAPATTPLPFTIWKFDHPDTVQEFSVMLGAWKWQAASEQTPAGMKIDSALIRLPVEPYPRPFKLVVVFKPLALSSRLDFDAYYYNGVERLPNQLWSKFHSFQAAPEYSMEYYFIDSWVIARLQGKISYVSDFGKAYPSKEVALSVSKCLVYRIELHYLESADIPSELTQPGLLSSKYGLVAGKDAGP